MGATRTLCGMIGATTGEAGGAPFPGSVYHRPWSLRHTAAIGVRRCPSPLSGVFVG